MDDFREHNPSIWIERSPTTEYPVLEQPLTVDVAIIGGGIVGLTTAVLLKDAGAKVAVLEAGRVATGASGYNAGVVTSLHTLIYEYLRKEIGDDSARRYAESNQAAVDWVANHVRKAHIDCDLTRDAAFTYTTDPAHLREIEAEVAAGVNLGLPASFVDRTELPFEVRGAVRFGNQIGFDPRKYCLGLAKAIPGDGCALFEKTRVIEIDDASPCLVTTDRGMVRAEQVVIATQVPIVNDGEFFEKTTPLRSYGLAARIDGPLPSGFYVGVGSDAHSVRSYRSGDRAYLIVTGESHWVGQEPDTRLRYAALERWTRAHFPVTGIDYQWSGQDYLPADRVPYIGRVTSHTRRLYTATGLKNWGLSLGTVAGLVLSDAVLDRANPWAVAYDAARLDVFNSVRRLVTTTADSARHLFRDRAEHGAVVSPDAIGAGEAGLVKVDGKTVAMSRDAAGTALAVSPDCTHLGCAVTWNTAELTWDCPCHGSRFARDGRMIHAPAVRDLERKTIGS